ncbi:MAG: AEC family transporter [Bacteroidales bacterium]
MTVNLQVFETVFAFIMVIMLCLLLRKYSIIKEEDGKTFSNLLIKAVLPAVIFLQLSATPIKSSQFLLVFAVFVAGVLSMLLAWVAGRLLQLTKSRTGALMLTSSFGSSALIGYPFIAFSFENNPEAMADAVLLSELGVGLPMFILGPAIAIIFGEKAEQLKVGKALSWSYFRTPIFISIILGVLCSFLPIDRSHSYIAPFFEALKMLSGALSILACLTIALQLKLIPLKGIIPMFIISALIQMGFQPWIANVQAGLYNLSTLQTQVLVLISSLPSALLGPVFARQYDCAPETASALVMAHIVFSIVMVPAVFYLMG